MAKKTPKPSTPTGALKPKGYKTTKWPPPSPARSPKPLTEAEREILGFYDKTRIISIDRASGRFVYNPEILPRVRQPTRLRRGIEPLGGPHPVEVGNESLLFWRSRVLGARMRYLRMTGRYNPYLRRGTLMRSSRGQKAVDEELISYLRLKREEDERESMVLEKMELVDYVKMLEDRERARQADEEADAAEVEKLLEEIWPNIEGSIDTGGTTVSESKDEDMLVKEPAKIENESRDGYGDDGSISPKDSKISGMEHGAKRKTKRKVKRKTKRAGIHFKEA